MGISMIRDIEINPVKLAKVVPEYVSIAYGVDLETVIQDLVDTAKHWQTQPNGCVGLAANQIGYPYRVIVIWFGGKFMPMIDPKITHSGRDKQTRPEGCLSRPGISTRKKRHVKITVAYWDENEDLIEQKFTKNNARVTQHEIDHLNGICI